MTTFFVVFASIFLAELGDKTQLATPAFAAEEDRARMLVFAASGAALVASSAIAVVLGAVAEKFIAGAPLNLIAGAGFMIIGALMIIESVRA